MIWFLIAGSVFFLDTVIKGWAEAHLDKTPGPMCFRKTIFFRKLHNYGMACNLGEKNPDLVKWGTMGLFAGVLVRFLWLITRPGHWIGKIGNAFVLAGGGSNLADRIGKGYVTDYFSWNVKWKKLRRLVFNVSDVFIFLGSILMVLDELTGKKKRVG